MPKANSVTFFTQPFADALDKSITEPNVVQASEIERILQTYIQRSWRGEIAPEDALSPSRQRNHADSLGVLLTQTGRNLMRLRP